MERFFATNPGIRSRIAHHIDFPDYEPDELLAIAEIMLGRMEYRLSPEARTALAEYVDLRRAQPNFANARSIRNALDRSRLRQANRLFVARCAPLTRDDLMTIEAADVRASRVFDAAPDEAAAP